MSILKTFLNNVWTDICSVDYRLFSGGSWYKIKNGDKVYANGAWKDIICSYAFKWVIDTDQSECEKSNVIVDVPWAFTNPFYSTEYLQIYLDKMPGTIPVFKKNTLTGHYLFNLDFIHKDSLGGGPNVYTRQFADGNPNYVVYTNTPIGQISDASLYPAARIEITGTGNYGLAIRGHIDPQGRIWIDAAPEKAITAWNASNPIYHATVVNQQYASEFGGVNAGVNTGFAINHKYKKVSVVGDLPLDNQNQLVKPELGNVQDTMDILSSDPNYRTLNLTKCPADNSTFGNQVQSQNFTRNNCPGGTTAGSGTYTVPANTYYASTIAAANQLALNDIAASGQNSINQTAACTPVLFGNEQQQQSFIRNNCTGDQQGSSVMYIVPAFTYTASTQAAANQLALDNIAANGQNYANANGTCETVIFRNVEFSQNFTRNNCGVDSTGSSVTYTVAANTYSASTQAAANQLALDNIAANGQNYANANGTCTLNATVPITLNNQMGSNPLTWVGVVIYKNGVETDRITYQTSGVMTIPTTYRVGDTIRITQFHYTTNFPWAPSSKGNLSVTRNGAGSLYNADNTDPNVVGLNELIRTLVTGDTSIEIVSTGSSTASGYITKTLSSINNNLAYGDVNVEIEDNFYGNSIFNGLLQLTSGSAASYPFNYFDSPDLLTVIITNNSATTMSYSLTGEFSFSQAGAIPAGSSVTITNVPKGSISLTTSN